MVAGKEVRSVRGAVAAMCAGAALVALVWPLGAAAAPAAKQAVTRSVKPVPAVRASSSAGRVRVAIPARAVVPARVAPAMRRASRSAATVAAASPSDTRARMSAARRQGLHATHDPLQLGAGAALVLDQDSGRVVFEKNSHAVLPIASLTKLMTGWVLSHSRLPMDELITITEADVDTLKGSRSRLPVGTTLRRGELLKLALMSSENRAAHALARTYPGGLDHFVQLMNAHAQLLGMQRTRYVEPTGLSSDNRSSPHDLARLVAAAANDPLLSYFSTSKAHDVVLGDRVVGYRTTNALLWEPGWAIGVQKTGYISEAGRCMALQAEVHGRRLVMVLLDSDTGASRLADARRMNEWAQLSPGARAAAEYAYSYAN